MKSNVLAPMMWSTVDRRLMRSAGALLAVLVVAGCQSAPNTSVDCRPARGQPQVGSVFISAGGTAVEARRPGVDSVLMSPLMGERLSIRTIELGKSATGLATLQSELANCTDGALLVRLRTQFLDAQGRPSEPVSIWRDMPIGLRSVAFYEEKASSPASRHFLLEVDAVTPAAR
jgi:hypothetical protein